MLSKFFTSTFDNNPDFDGGVAYYYDCTLKEDVGNYHKGDIINCISINYITGKAVFYKSVNSNIEDDYYDPVKSFDIKLCLA